MRRLLPAAAALLWLLGCQAEPATRSSATRTTTSAPKPVTMLTTHPPNVPDDGFCDEGEQSADCDNEPRPRGVLGDGVCDELERGSNSDDCDQKSLLDQVPPGWVSCRQTGAWCPPDYDTPTLAYDPAPGRRWTYVDELEFERRLRELLQKLAPRSSWPTTRFGTYDHSWPNDPGPGSASRPIQPYSAFGSDPNDADGDGVACEYGCRN